MLGSHKMVENGKNINILIKKYYEKFKNISLNNFLTNK